MKPGTDSTDSECGEHGAHAGLVAGIISGVIMVMALIIGGLFLYKKRGKCCINLKCIMVTLTNMYHVTVN